MKQNGIGLLIAISLLRATPASASPLQDFVSQPAQLSWLALERSVSTTSGAYDASIVGRVCAFRDAALLRDLPNSMALDGTTPAENANRNFERAEASFAELRPHRSEQLWSIVHAMALQGFDEALLSTAAEIVARLWPDRFAALAAEVKEKHADQAWIFEAKRGWLNK